MSIFSNDLGLTVSENGEWLNKNKYIQEICVRGPRASGRTTAMFDYVNRNHPNDLKLLIFGHGQYINRKDFVKVRYDRDKALVEHIPHGTTNFVLMVDVDNAHFSLEDFICLMGLVDIIKVIWVRLPCEYINKENTSLVFG